MMEERALPEVLLTMSKWERAVNMLEGRATIQSDLTDWRSWLTGTSWSSIKAKYCIWNITVVCNGTGCGMSWLKWPGDPGKQKLSMSQHCALTAIKAVVCWALRTSQGNDYSLLCGIYESSSPKIFTQCIESKSMWQVRKAWGRCVCSFLKIGSLKGDHISVYKYLVGRYRENGAKLFSEIYFGRRGTRNEMWWEIPIWIKKKGFFYCLLDCYIIGIVKDGWTRWALETSMNLWSITNHLCPNTAKDISLHFTQQSEASAKTTAWLWCLLNIESALEILCCLKNYNMGPLKSKSIQAWLQHISDFQTHREVD